MRPSLRNPPTRLAALNKAIEEASGVSDTSPIGMIKKGRSPLEGPRTAKQQRDLRIQLSDAGISKTKNSQRDKLRLRQIRENK